MIYGHFYFLFLDLKRKLNVFKDSFIRGLLSLSVGPWYSTFMDDCNLVLSFWLLYLKFIFSVLDASLSMLVI